MLRGTSDKPALTLLVAVVSVVSAIAAVNLWIVGLHRWSSTGSTNPDSYRHRRRATTVSVAAATITNAALVVAVILQAVTEHGVRVSTSLISVSIRVVVGRAIVGSTVAVVLGIGLLGAGKKKQAGSSKEQSNADHVCAFIKGGRDAKKKPGAFTMLLAFTGGRTCCMVR